MIELIHNNLLLKYIEIYKCPKVITCSVGKCAGNGRASPVAARNLFAQISKVDDGRSSRGIDNKI